MHFYKESFFGWGYQKCKSSILILNLRFCDLKRQRFISSGNFQIQIEIFIRKFIGDSDVGNIVM